MVNLHIGVVNATPLLFEGLLTAKSFRNEISRRVRVDPRISTGFDLEVPAGLYQVSMVNDQKTVMGSSRPRIVVPIGPKKLRSATIHLELAGLKQLETEEEFGSVD